MGTAGLLVTACLDSNKAHTVSCRDLINLKRMNVRQNLETHGRSDG